jgi:hypothetical protein
MKYTYRIVCIGVILVGLVAGTAIAGTLVELRPGESKTVEGITLGFEGVLSEGRCPIGLFCFWEGDAACGLWAEMSERNRLEFVLHTSDTFGRTITYGGREIGLKVLDPYPVYERPTDPDDYVVTLQLSHEQLTPTEESTWSRIKALYR